MNHLTTAAQLENAERSISDLKDKCGEWFYTEKRGGVPVTLRSGEWRVEATHGQLLFFCLGDARVRTWRIVGWHATPEKLVLQATRRMGAEQAVLELVPRAKAAVATAAVAAARRAASEHLAGLALANLNAAKIEQVSLSPGQRSMQPGRYARILLRRLGSQGGIVAVTGAVVDLTPGDIDAFLASALLWFTRLEGRRVPAASPPGIMMLWLVAAKHLTDALRQRLALLRQGLRRVIKLYEMNCDKQTLTAADMPELTQVLQSAPPRLHHPPQRGRASEPAQRIVALAPGAIDVVPSKHGETLRFHGLAFARVRSVVGRTRVWFGIDRIRRQPLDEDSWPQLTKLIHNLEEHRRNAAEDQQHHLYKVAAEAWLESLLRRDITQLDPGLVISPLYTQFRTARNASPSAGGGRPIDLIALRQDKRLVVIELKVAEDTALPVQAADYWRHVEVQRRCGNLSRANLFGEAALADQPPLVYLVAPMLRFHRSFPTLTQAIAPEIEMYRFDINEDWRGGVRVTRRLRVNSSRHWAAKDEG